MTKEQFEKETIFAGGDVSSYGKYFTGTSYLNMLVPGGKVPVAHVMFEPGCINHWHTHSGGQILLVTGGRGHYCAWGEGARTLQAGDVVVVGAGVKHWHGAAKDSWFSHLAIEVPGSEAEGGWLEPVDPADYARL